MESRIPDVKAWRWRSSRRVTLATWLGVSVPLALLIAVLLLVTWPVAAAGPTYVSGPIEASTTWRRADTPYIVTGDVVVRNGAVLTIEHGVEVRFYAATELRVADGRLIADGTTTDPITFTANTVSERWAGIAFENTTQPGTVRHCLVEYAGTGISTAESDYHTIDRCTFRYNDDGGDLSSGGAINSEGDRQSITDNLIYENELGLRLRKSFYDVITGNQIHDNDGFGIGFIYQEASGGGNNLIRNNQIFGNGDDGVRLDDGSSNQILDNQIIDNGGHGLWAKDQSNLHVTGNILRANGGNGFTYAPSSLGSLTIHSNVLCNNQGFELQNQWDSSITATGNWFGTNSPGGSEISGPVAYDPWIVMDVTLVPDHLPADGTSTADLTLTMDDGDGHAVPDGYAVDVYPSEGSLLASTLTLSGGQATTTYTAGTVPGGVQFQVTDQCATIDFLDDLTLEAVDLAVDLTGPGGTTQPGASVTFVLDISELNGVDARDLILTDYLPDGTSWVSDTSDDCGLTLQGTSPHVVWTVDQWVGGTSCQFELTVLVDTDACVEQTLVNSAEVTSTTTDDDPSNNTASTSVDSPSVLCLDLAVSKDDGVGMVSLPWPDKAYLITYTLTYTNEGYVDASRVLLTDSLPSGTQVYASNGWTCVAGACTYAVDALSRDGPHTAPSLVVQVMTATLVGCPELLNTASIGDDGAQGADLDSTNNSFDLATPLPCLPDLVLTKTDGLDDCAYEGERITYTLTYRNVGLAMANDVVLAEEVPDHTTYVGAGWICVGDTCTQDIDPLPKDGSGSVQFVVEVSEPVPEDVITNTARIGALEADIDPRDDEVQITTDICPSGVDLQVEKSSGGLVVGPNKEYSIEYTITLTNAGTDAATGVVLTDVLPVEAFYTGSAWSCTAGTCSYNVGSLTPSESIQVSLPVQLEKNALDCPVVLTNKVQADDSTHEDLVPADNTFTLTSTFECLPDLVVVLNDNVGEPLAAEDAWLLDMLQQAPDDDPDYRSCVHPGEWISYSIAYVNAGLATATEVMLTETVPEHTSYIGPGWNCLGDTCTRSVGTLPPNQGGKAGFIVRVDTTPPDMLIEDQVRIGGAEEDLYPPDNVSSDDTPVCEGLSFDLSKDAKVPCAFPGDEIRYTIVFTNPSGEAAAGVVLTESLPAHTSYLPSAGWLPLGGGQYLYEVGPLPPYSSDTVEFAVRVDDPLPATVTQTVNIVCLGYDGPTPPDNCVQLITPLPSEPDLRVVKHDHVGPPPSTHTLQQLDRLYEILYDRPYRSSGPIQEWEPVRPGDVFSYTITYLNLGRRPATGVVLTETLPAHTSYVGDGWTHVGGNTYTYGVGGLGVREGGQAEFRVRVDELTCSSEEVLYNWVHIGGNEEECNLSNNWSGEETPVEWPPCEFGNYLPLVLRGWSFAEPPAPQPGVAYVKDVAVNPETNRVYIACPAFNSVLAVDPSGSGRVIANIPVGHYPLGLAVVTTNNKIYVANFYSWTVTAIRGSDHTPIVDRYVGAQACKVAADSADGRVYVTNHLESDNGAAAIDSETDQFEYYYSRLHATQGRYGIDVDPAADKLFIAARDAGLIAMQDAYYPDQDPLLFKLDPPRVPYVVAFNPTTKHLFVTAADDNRVVVLDPYSIQWNKGRWVPWRGRRVFLLDRSNAGWIKELGVGLGAEEGIAVNPLTGYVYVTNAGSNTVSILRDNPNPAQIVWVRDLRVGEQPMGVDVDVRRNLVYVGNAGSRDLTVIDGATHTIDKTIPLD